MFFNSFNTISDFESYLNSKKDFNLAFFSINNLEYSFFEKSFDSFIFFNEQTFSFIQISFDSNFSSFTVRYI